jgi:hypothetical protein
VFICVVAILELVCLYLCICACLDCEVGLNNYCDYCECAGWNILPIFTTALVFLVVCMLGGIFNCFIKCLDPSSV